MLTFAEGIFPAEFSVHDIARLEGLRPGTSGWRRCLEGSRALLDGMVGDGLLTRRDTGQRALYRFRGDRP